MAIDLSSIGNIGGSIGSIGNSFNAQTIIPFIMNIIFLSVGGFVLYLIVKRMLFWAEARIYVAGETGIREARKDFIIKKKNKKTGEISYRLIKGKCDIMEVTPECRYRLGKKYHVPLIEGNDGVIRPLPIALSYQDESGRVIPYMQPIDRSTRDYIFQTAMEKQAKYVLKDSWEKVAPYAAIAVTGIICVIMVFLTLKKF